MTEVESTYRIGEVAERFGVSTRTLRYYEEVGLIVPSGKSPGGSRRYSDADITRIERVITDNHFCYRNSYDVREALAVIGAQHKFIRPHCPWQNGKVERFNRTLAAEWAYRQVFTRNDDRVAALAPWLEQYNTVRRHSALGGLPPISRLSPT